MHQCRGNVLGTCTDYHEANRDLCYPFYSMSSLDSFPQTPFAASLTAFVKWRAKYKMFPYLNAVQFESS